MAYRNIVFTINNWTQEDKDLFTDRRIRYYIYGEEIGAEGTPHLQGYMEFSTVIKLGGIKKFLPRAHIEPRKGTQEQAIAYCKKDGQITEWGQKAAPGTRNDLDKVRLAALDGGMREVTARYNHQQIRVAEKFLTYNEEPRDWETHVTWLWGKTGAGKSRKARELCPDDCYTKNTGSKWWDGYDGHANVIIDDFRDSWWPLTEMLSLLDRYEKQVEVKGGMRQFKPQKIIVTCTHAPNDCYKGVGEDIAQLLRRVHVVENLVTEVTEVKKGNTKGLLDQITDIDNIAEYEGDYTLTDL